MNTKRMYLIPLLLAGSLAAFPAAGWSQDAHSHGGGAAELTLNHGAKWQTDEALRTVVCDRRRRAAITTAQKNRRILIIDDTPGIHQDFRKVLATARSVSHLEADERALFGDTDSGAPTKDGYEILTQV